MITELNYNIKKVTHSSFLLLPDSNESGLLAFGLRELRASWPRPHGWIIVTALSHPVSLTTVE